MKRIPVIIMMTLSMLLFACGKQSVQADSTSEPTAETASVQEENTSAETVTSEEPEAQEAPAVTDSDELFNLFLTSLKEGTAEEVYDFNSQQIKDLISPEAYKKIFTDLTDTYGSISDIKDVNVTDNAGMKQHNASAVTDHAVILLQMYINGTSIEGFNFIPVLSEPFTKTVSDNVKEDYFFLESGDLKLTAVYTHSDKENAPVALLIPGSGISDCNESVGLLAPFKDMAGKLAERGINSLRVEKRTNLRDAEINQNITLNEEYFIDYGNAYNWIKNNTDATDIYLVGHSLGTQIALEMSKDHDVSGLILFNGTLRHLADVVLDQVVGADTPDIEGYKELVKAAKNSTDENATGTYYYGATDYYWAGYNKLDFVKTLKEAKVPIAVINSDTDAQLFESDYELWREIEKDNYSFVLLHNVNHFGYADTAETVNVYSDLSFSDEVIDNILSLVENK